MNTSTVINSMDHLLSDYGSYSKSRQSSSSLERTMMQKKIITAKTANIGPKIAINVPFGNSESDVSMSYLLS